MHQIAESGVVNEQLVDERSSALDGPSTDQPLVENAGGNKSIMGRLVKVLIVLAILIGGAVFGLYRCALTSRGLTLPRFTREWIS
jgi:hypothetical protein